MATNLVGLRCEPKFYDLLLQLPTSQRVLHLDVHIAWVSKSNHYLWIRLSKSAKQLHRDWLVIPHYIRIFSVCAFITEVPSLQGGIGSNSVNSVHHLNRHVANPPPDLKRKEIDIPTANDVSSENKIAVRCKSGCLCDSISWRVLNKYIVPSTPAGVCTPQHCLVQGDEYAVCPPVRSRFFMCVGRILVQGDAWGLYLKTSDVSCSLSVCVCEVQWYAWKSRSDKAETL